MSRPESRPAPEPQHLTSLALFTSCTASHDCREVTEQPPHSLPSCYCQNLVQSSHPSTESMRGCTESHPLSCIHSLTLPQNTHTKPLPKPCMDDLPSPRGLQPISNTTHTLAFPLTLVFNSGIISEMLLCARCCAWGWATQIKKGPDEAGQGLPTWDRHTEEGPRDTLR